ncbi:hypothetical protein, partial [Klebsiella pneumoniae]|uniref:hypothetical protein n=1 Tax=Klebsiella pneumoniae TaxID=573 RepID=UPI003EE2CAFD
MLINAIGTYSASQPLESMAITRRDPGRIWNNFNRRGDCLRLPCGEEHGCINDICPFAIGINRWLR